MFIKYCLSCLLVLILLNGCIFANQNSTKIPVSQLPALGSSLKPGLQVYYRYAFYRHLNQMASDDVMVAEGIQGKPVLLLNHKFEGEIFDSKKEKGVGVFLSGYLKMKVPGTYRFQAISNDGLRVTVNTKRVIFDPPVHSDRLSEIGEVLITTPKWYPIAVKYYQRKGSARLELYWQPPGAKGFEIIPAASYGHK